MSWLWWGTAAASLVAVWLNIKRLRACFAIWAVTNVTWAYADFTHGLPAQGTLQVIYFLLSIHGYRAWRDSIQPKGAERCYDD